MNDGTDTGGVMERPCDPRLDLAAPLGKAEAARLAMRYGRTLPPPTRCLLEMLVGAGQPAFRAAWVLELMVWNRPGCLSDAMPQFVASFATVRNEGAKRHLAKIMARLVRLEEARLEGVDLLPVVEAAFEWLLADATRVAVKVHCIELLHRLSGRYAWIRDELPALVASQVRGGSPALAAVAKRVLGIG